MRSTERIVGPGTSTHSPNQRHIAATCSATSSQLLIGRRSLSLLAATADRRSPAPRAPRRSAGFAATCARLLPRDRPGPLAIVIKDIGQNRPDQVGRTSHTVDVLYFRSRALASTVRGSRGTTSMCQASSDKSSRKGLWVLPHRWCGRRVQSRCVEPVAALGIWGHEARKKLLFVVVLTRE